MRHNGWRTHSAIIALLPMLAACSGDGGSSSSGGTTPVATTYSVTASVSNLDTAGLVLANGGSTITVAANATSASILSGAASGTTYAVTVQTQPAGETCTVVNGSGTIAGNVTNIAVSCIHTVGGLKAPRFTETVLNLPAGTLVDPSDLEPIDFDADGDLDLFAANVAPPTNPATTRPQLAFRNVGGTFVNATSEVLGSLIMTNPRRLRVADFNGDGRSDLFIAETGSDTDPYAGEQSRLLIQTAGGKLADETAARMPQHKAYTHGADVADINGDGLPDIYMGNLIPSDLIRLYLNTAPGPLIDRSDLLPADVSSGYPESPSAGFCDLNNDKRPELIIGGAYYDPTGPSSFRPNSLLMNDGTGRFVHDANFTMPSKAGGDKAQTTDVACADLNGDGFKDVVLASDTGFMSGSPQMPYLQLLINDGQGHLIDKSSQLGLTFKAKEHWVVHIIVTDINNDGTPDLVLRTNSENYAGNVPSTSLLLNRGDGTFVNASDTFNANLSNAIAVGDFDKDGLMDIAMIEPDRLRLFKGRAP